MSFLIPAAYAQETAPAAAAPGGEYIQFIFLIGFVVIFYFLIWRPQAKRAKEHKNLLGNLQKGDEVVTSGGIAGRVVKVADDFVVIEVSDTVELKFQKGAIAATLPKGTLKAI
ncbi:preprotein translocase subunit YajC [Pseudomonas asuensis]|jgi:preprotein translocase subunit YajC|uniref:Sec translocon accessory complex subunit YajC n=1 Tax=Pseudomonas asuensis TaxID=1825787 RepID=A0ABQ2GNT3_9PSED|nr:preprotein translocase subunit YajC [Pseudomonas asuensis]GGM04596.1 preprotein translocase subunit YajC [Pseudomonas asuensis]